LAAAGAQGTVTVNADGSFSITPPEGFDGTLAFQVRVANLVGSADGSVTVAVDAPPRVLATSPLDGAAGVKATSEIVLTFSEAVTAPATAFRIECPAGTSVPFSPSGWGTDRVVLTPAAPLPIGASCLVTVAGPEVLDADSDDGPDAMAAGHELAFTVESGTPPRASDDEYLVAAGSPLLVPAPGVTADDDSGVPAATITSFGGGSLGGTVTSYAPGTSVALPGGGSVLLNVDGSLSVDTGGNTGELMFQYRLTNTAGTSDATVTIVAEEAPPVDFPPLVASTTPADGATGVAPGASITIRFDEEVRAGPEAFGLQCPVGPANGRAFTLNDVEGQEFVLTPTQPMPLGTTCRVFVDASDVRDTDKIDPPDRPEEDYVFRFTIGTPPSAAADGYQTVANTVLNQGVPGLLGNDVTGVPSGSVASFGGGSLGGSVTSHSAGTSAVFGGTGSVTVNADGSFSVTPPNGFLGDVTFLYRVSNASGSSDALVTVQVQDAAPAILSTSPVNGATSVPASSNLVATFTEPVFVAVPPTFQCTVSGTLTIADFVPSGGPTGFTLDPIVDFAPGETCTGVIPASVVTDVDTDDPPDNMAADFVFSFTIEAAPAVDAAFDLEASFVAPDLSTPESSPWGGGAFPRSPSAPGHGMSESFSLAARATVPEHVLFQEIEGQSAILHLEANEYFGLDDVGTDIWRAATNGATVGEAIDFLSNVYEVDYERLKDDVVALLNRLNELGLVEMQ
jgi:hypothetical protein